MMNKSDFAEILRDLYKGNKGQAEQTAETILYDNKSNLTEEWERQRQEKINYEVAKYNRLCYNNIK